MKLHTITDIKLYGPGDTRLLLRFDEKGPELNAMVDLSPIQCSRKAAFSSGCAIRTYFSQ
jgi:hypothetical protein